MPLDEYASASAGGALRIKGAKVKKHKKKKTGKSDLEKNLSTGGGGGDASSSSSTRKRKDDEQDAAFDEDPTAREAQEEETATTEDQDNDNNNDHTPSSSSYRGHKTETERKFEEVRRKRLLELSEQANARPGLLKTHKERVEELNTYLSKLSEHHDMPKIGPG
ncbi:hypothetical protein BD289DRAFT_365600 [Coniella lustricola]|uniref:DUF1754-domain-containing protein n=1 Tax=Coniella lustricola TaxID=2025994 RepID=A0A2T3AC99_9PEZI|nr:hypothetical protein BD289DRAFT_365600 [Coniella lustricola]